MDRKKINRGNKNRGAALEKYVADYLDMDVVPYSGSNDRFGWGDIRDSKWLGECKNITPDNNNKITIKIEWFTKNDERSGLYNKMPFLAFMPRGQAKKYIILTQEVMKLVKSNVPNLNISEYYQSKGSHNAKNMIIILDALYYHTKDIDTVIKHNIEGGSYYYIMRIELFKKILFDYKMKGTRNTI